MMNASEMTNEELAKHIECGDAILREAAARLRTFTLLSKAHQRLANDSVDYESNLLRKLKVAEDALEAASDAFRFCIEQCELELGPRMIGKLCDDGKAVERALDAIHEKGVTK